MTDEQKQRIVDAAVRWRRTLTVKVEHPGSVMATEAEMDSCRALVAAIDEAEGR